jgi:hypothetical protein
VLAAGEQFRRHREPHRQPARLLCTEPLSAEQRGDIDRRARLVGQAPRRRAVRPHQQTEHLGRARYDWRQVLRLPPRDQVADQLDPGARGWS